jgi:hypothetical protein
MRWSDAGWLARLVAGLILALGGDVLSSRAYGCTDDGHSHAPMTPAGCSGPNCSAPGPAPLIPESTPRLVAPEVWGHALRTSDQDSPPAPAGWLRSPDDAPLPPLASSIFHPPR